MTETTRTLRLTFHGRILDHLGIQMYQSPVAAIAELISNAWDADAEKVEVTLPLGVDPDAEIVIQDDGVGMTFDECQDRYLNVGLNRRGDEPNALSSEKGRPILGRKGIGKFAGFGIAVVIRVETVSKKTGEMTVFELDMEDLRSGDYAQTVGGQIENVEYTPPDEDRRDSHGTKITLKRLRLTRRPPVAQFLKSMARRFLLNQRADDFQVLINGDALPSDDALEGVEYSFPDEYREDEKPEGIQIENGWALEILANGQEIKWRINFYKDPIDEEELRGISIFSRGKLAQKPFFFNLSGGLSGQHGQEYMSGQVEADYLDEQEEDLIATERQRINWQHEPAIPLEEWGQSRIRSLLSLWRDRRGEKRRRDIEEKVATFSNRLEKLPAHEKRVVKNALNHLGGISTLSDEQFQSLGEAILLAWEQGRLQSLIDDVSNLDELSVEDLLSILIEAQVLTALNTAEAVKTKLLIVGGLKLKIERSELETAVRDFIAEYPWLISPEWETFRKERSVEKLKQDAAGEAGMTGDAWQGRVDLTLASGQHILILEFMRPGLCLDWDHVERFERYIRNIRSSISANTGGRFNMVTGFIIADEVNRDPAILDKIKDMEKLGMLVLDWNTLFERALAQWSEFLDILVTRAPEDERLQALMPRVPQLDEPQDAG